MTTITKLLLDSFEDLPNELILRIFSYLNLRGLIASRGVSRKWRTLVPFTNIAPARKDMLDFYDYLLNSPLFFKTRPWVLANLKPFDRLAYVAKLTRQYPSLPEDFQQWVLEWPERAVVACSWPGLPRRRYMDQYADNINVIEGINWMAYPQVSVLTYADTVNRKAEHIPGILVHVSLKTTWLILDERENMCGKVFHAGVNDFTLEGSLESDQLKYSFDSLDQGWNAYQRQIWKDVEDQADNCAKTGIHLWKKLEDIPVDRSADAFPEAIELGGTAWLRRNEAYTQERLRLANDALLRESGAT